MKKKKQAGGVERKTMALNGPEAFKMKAKKPEPDDKPRPINRGGQTKAAKRLKGVML